MACWVSACLQFYTQIIKGRGMGGRRGGGGGVEWGG